MKRSIMLRIHYEDFVNDVDYYEDENVDDDNDGIILVMVVVAVVVEVTMLST